MLNGLISKNGRLTGELKQKNKANKPHRNHSSAVSAFHVN